MIYSIVARLIPALLAVLCATASAETLAEARAAHRPTWRASAYEAAPAIPTPIGTSLALTKYKSPAGELAALLSKNPGDGKRHPAVLWAHGGFGGLSSYYWEPQPATNDQTPKALLDAGFVVMLPAWRGENDNPGRFEMFYGEVDDALAAIEHLRSLPYVDPDRVYMIGHSTGGTIALLTALSTDKLRAVFAFGGVLDMTLVASEWDEVPFDPADREAIRVRSAIHFLKQLKTPTWDIEGSRASNKDRLDAQQIAKEGGLPLNTCIIAGGNHFDILRPSTQLIAKKLMADTGPTCNITLSTDELAAEFGRVHAERLAKLKNAPVIQLTPAAQALLRKVVAQNRMDPKKVWLDVTNGLDLVEEFNRDTHAEFTSGEFRIAVPKELVEACRGTVINAVGNQFAFESVLED